jgi:hypothetical protein
VVKITITIDIETIQATVEVVEEKVETVEQKTLADFHDEHYEVDPDVVAGAVGDYAILRDRYPAGGMRYPANRNPHHCTRCDREGRQRSHNRGWRCIGCQDEEQWDE